MRRFLLHLFAFAVLQAVVGAWVWSQCPTDPDHYMAATIDKHARLRGASRPRLILVGGSSMGFGLDSRVFLDHGLELAPVNMGLNDGLGLNFMLAETADQLGVGDVVIVAPETHLYWHGSRDDTLWAVLEHRPASVACLSGKSARELSDQGLHFLSRKLRCAAHQVAMDSVLATIYRRGSFDEFGDFVAHRDQPRKSQAPLEQAWPAANSTTYDEAATELGAFATRCRLARARCFLAWSPTRREQFERGSAVFSVLLDTLRSVDLPMLESPDEAIFADEDFFDRGPHLTGEAATRRSTRLAERLAEALATPSPPER